MQAVTIVQITPDELSELIEKSVLKVLSEMKSKSDEEAKEDKWFNLGELCMYLPDKPSKPTVYGWVNAGRIPVHKGTKRLRFLKSEIDDWMKNK